MNLVDKYQIITDKMRRINYEMLWPGFHQYNIALYDDSMVCYQGNIIPKTDEFMANTSIKYNNEMIGIWNMLEDMDVELLASKLIHETFHAYQTENKESRFPNEIKALINYRYDAVNLSMKAIENKLIVKMIESFNLNMFNQFIQIRRQRFDMFPYEVNYEMAIEQIEGTANYVELESLKQLNIEKYQNKLKSMCRSIITDKNLLPIRIISYDIGALLIKIINDNKLQMNFEFNNQYFLSHYLQSVCTIDVEYGTSEEINKLINLYYQETERYIENSTKEENIIARGDFELLGVNIYNARYYQNSIVTEYFLMYKDEENQKILYGNYLAKINDKLRITEIYKLIK